MKLQTSCEEGAGETMNAQKFGFHLNKCLISPFRGLLKESESENLPRKQSQNSIKEHTLQIIWYHAINWLKLAQKQSPNKNKQQIIACN